MIAVSWLLELITKLTKNYQKYWLTRLLHIRYTSLVSLVCRTKLVPWFNKAFGARVLVVEKLQLSVLGIFASTDVETKTE